MPRKKPAKISAPVIVTPADDGLDAIMNALNIPEVDPMTEAARQEQEEFLRASQTPSRSPLFVNEPITELSDTAPSPEIEQELVAAAHALDPTSTVQTPEDVSEELFKFTDQDREAMVYGVVDMENTPSEVAKVYNTRPEVVLLAIQMERMRRGLHEADVTRNW